MNRIPYYLTAISFFALACSCSPPRESSPASTQAVKQSSSVPLPTMIDDKPRDYPGIHNAVAYHDGFVSGSAPEGEAGFDTLSAMGVKTIISVDGAEPEVDKASARGMRYIHLPIGYNGFDEQRKLQLVRATRDAMKEGPVYIHCHHGKHRSAGAAATVVASLGWLTPKGGVDRMHVSGTAPDYKGLYACANNSIILASHVIDRVPADFPSVWKPTGYVKGMVEVDHVYDNLKAIEKAGWITPANHPDLIPAAEAGRLADLFRVLNETDYVKQKPPELAMLMHESNVQSQKFEDLIVAGEKDSAKLSDQFKLIGTSCKACHVKFRD